MNAGSPPNTGTLVDAPLELSVVIPCLNESETIGACVDAAVRGLASSGMTGEVIVADNGSRDGSPEIALRHGARVVHVLLKGYGNALMGGIAAAQGQYLLMGDADGQHDFSLIPKFVARLREGFELAQGCRLPSGGGTISPGGMSWSHRWFGNPLFSLLARFWFGAPVHDVYCGMRAFTKELYGRLDPRCTGMEFSIEMILKASLHKAKIAEVPITVHPAGRTLHGAHMRTFRDGWRTLRFFLVYSPRWIFLLPGMFLILLGLAGYGIALADGSIGAVKFDAHALVLSSLALVLGYQAALFALFSKTFAVNEGLMPPDPRLARFYELVDLEKGLLAGGLGLVTGLMLLVAPLRHWPAALNGAPDYARTMRWIIPGATLTALSVQTILSGFFVSMLGLKRR